MPELYDQPQGFIKIYCISPVISHEPALDLDEPAMVACV
jgi:hypothetical protein